MIRALVIALAALVGLAGQPAQAQRGWIEAEGRAIIHSAADRDAARRRALADALIAAALTGGVEVVGHSMLDQNRLTADRTLMRPTGRVIEHRLLGASEVAGEARVRIAARVAPANAGDCTAQPTSRLVLRATPPEGRATPDTPAWALPLGLRLAGDALTALADHPAIDLTVVSTSPAVSSGRRRPEGLDYATLAASPRPAAPNQTTLHTHVRLSRETGNLLVLTLDLRLTGGPGDDRRLTLRREARLAGVSLGRDLGELAATRRPQIESALARDLVPAITDWARQVTCAPLEARLALTDGVLGVSLGRENGLGPGALAFLDDRDGGLGVFEITSLNARSARLRPLDPTQPLTDLVGRRVRFAETGL